MHHRTLHLRDTHGFSDEDRARFAAGCRLFHAHVVCCLRELRVLGEEGPPDESYDFENPSRSDDGTVLSLRIRGLPTLGARHSFENLSCHLLSHFFPVEHRRRMEEGITEDVGVGESTSWRAVPAFTVHWAP